MDFSRVRVLIPGAGGKQALLIVRGLKQLGCHVTVICAGPKATCYVSNQPDEKILNEHIARQDEQGWQDLLQMVSARRLPILSPNMRMP